MDNYIETTTVLLRNSQIETLFLQALSVGLLVGLVTFFSLWGIKILVNILRKVA